MALRKRLVKLQKMMSRDRETTRLGEREEDKCNYPLLFQNRKYVRVAAAFIPAADATDFFDSSF